MLEERRSHHLPRRLLYSYRGIILIFAFELFVLSLFFCSETQFVPGCDRQGEEGSSDAKRTEGEVKEYTSGEFRMCFQ